MTSKPHPKTDDPNHFHRPDAARGADSPPADLPHERDQQPGSQSPAAGQDKTHQAQQAERDARLGRPDTSAPPQLQQPSPQDKR